MKTVQGKQGCEQNLQMNVGKCKGDGEVAAYADWEGWAEDTNMRTVTRRTVTVTDSQGVGGSPSAAPRVSEDREEP